MKRNAGFTLIELLIVIGVIGALAGVTIGIINPNQQKAMAEDAVIKKDVHGAAIALETFFAAEDFYPDPGGDNNPLTGSDANVTQFYIDPWPAGAVYLEATVANTQYFSVHMQKSSDDEYYKYNSAWKEVRECALETGPIDDVRSCD